MAKTSIDTAKEAAEIRIIDADGTYTVRSKVALSGRGITPRNTLGTYEVSKVALSKLERTHRVVCDF
jgi:hypothetical protein